MTPSNPRTPKMTDEKVKALLERMANECSVDMVLWDQFSNAVLALSGEVERLTDENDKLRGMPDDDRKSCIALMEMLAEARADRDAYRKTMEAMVEAPDAIAKLLADYDALQAKLTALVEALGPFAEAASHLHPSQPDDGLTLDGIEVRHWRRAAQALAHHSAPVGDGRLQWSREFLKNLALELLCDREGPSEAERLFRDFPARVEMEISRTANAAQRALDRDREAAPTTTPTSAPVEDVGGLAEGGELDETSFAMCEGWARRLDSEGLHGQAAAIRQVAALARSLIQPQGEERSDDSGLAAADDNHLPDFSLDTPYVPVAIHYRERDVLEFVERDVPVVEKAFAHASLSVLLDVHTREPVGWRIPGWSSIAPPADDNHKALVEALRADLEQVIHQLDDPYTDGWGDNDALIQGEIERLQNMHRSLAAFQSRQEESR